MSVTEQTPLNAALANGVTTVFSYSFMLLLADDLTVKVTDPSGISTTKTLGVDYTVAGVGSASGGTVTFLVAPANGYTVTIYRDSGLERRTDYQNNGDLLAVTVNADFDRLWLALQEIYSGGKGAPNSLRVPNGETVPELGNKVARANRVQAYDGNGDPTLIVGVDASSAAALALDLLSANGVKGSTLVNYLATGTGAVARLVQKKLSDVVSVKDFGAKGDATADDTAAIQAAADYAMSIRGELVFPANDAGAYYKITAPIVFTSALCIRGAGVQATTIFGVGLSAGAYLFDFNCVAANTVEEITVSGLTLRSNNQVPNGLRLKNVAHILVKALRLYNLANGIYIDGTRCYTHSFEQVNSTQINSYVVHWAPAFVGGGQYVFTGCAFYSNVGVFLPTTAFIDNLSFVGCNWEQNTGNCMVLNGTAAAVSIVGSRTEGCDGVDFVIAPTGAAEFVGGLHVAGNVLSASDAGAAARLRLGGGAGKVRGFSVTGNVITHGTDSFVGSLVELNGDGESGIISGNFVRGITGGVVNTQRAGVAVFANENLSGKLAEWWGTAQAGFEQGNWTPVDGSAAALSFTVASGRWTRTGRTVFWQAFIIYPATASGASAEVGGLPFAIGGLTGNAEGRAGGRCDLSNVGSDVGVMQGVTSNTEFAFYSPTALTAITNATLSGKQLYCSGTYSL